MNIAEFWAKAEKIFNEHNKRARGFITSDDTGEEHHENVADFLTEMDLLASAWYSREDIKETKK